MQPSGDDFIGTLVASARKTISEGYYRVGSAGTPKRSLGSALKAAKGLPLITEVKFRSPSEGMLKPKTDVREIARRYQRGGAAAISVLTEPKHFDGRLEYLTAVKRSVDIPVLMKDIVIDPVQIDAAEKVGADCVLLMDAIFRAGLSGFTLDHMVQHAHEKGLEVLLEAHTEEEYAEAVQTGADMVGINNRDLRTLQVSMDTSRNLLRKIGHPKTVVCESGFSKPSELLELRALGADAFLVGSALMKSGDPEVAVRSLVEAS
jgi:indole-3-glycerol phosphate synthase